MHVLGIQQGAQEYATEVQLLFEHRVERGLTPTAVGPGPWL